ncbi:hypothetical protein BH10BAC3_BH10BAC3_09210 [soil metagenome]
MKRRAFLHVTVGATIITPLLAGAAGEENVPIDPPPGLIPLPVGEAGKWFMNEPTRIGWFTLRYSDAQKSAAEFVQQVADAKMNLLCLTVGGSFAFYPSAIPYHEWAPGISASNDFFGKIAGEAKAENIRIGARFDYSKQSADAVKAHPEWFFTLADGTHPVDASGRTPPCINGDFFRRQAVLIMEEVISRYHPGLVYLNNFGNNLGGQNLPDPCQCENCKRNFLEKTGKPLPQKMTDEVRVFLKHSTYETGRLFFEAVQKLSPGTILINADTTPTHGWHSETRMVIAPSRVWLYITSEAVSRQRTSYPGSVTCNNVTSYSSNASRLVLMPAQETRVRLFQAMAHGSPPTYVATGTMQQDDQRDLEAARQVFLWHARNQDLFGGTVNPARVLILAQPESAPRGRNLVTQQSLRGIYRILAENHIPAVVSETVDTIYQQPGRFDLVIVAPGAMHSGLEDFVKQGGRALYIGEAPSFAIPAPVQQHDLTRVAYIEVRDTNRFPSMKGLKYLLGSAMCPYNVIDIFSSAEVESMRFTEYPEEPNPALSFVPPMIENPAEVSQSDLTHTNIPALLMREHGAGHIAYLPWDLGALYDRLAIPSHSGLLTDLYSQLLPAKRQLETDAHSSVEIVLAYQEKTGRHFLHLVNLSGQTQNNYMDAIPMGRIHFSIVGNFKTAKARDLNTSLPLSYINGHTAFVLPSLKEYEIIVLE